MIYYWNVWKQLVFVVGLLFQDAEMLRLRPEVMKLSVADERLQVLSLIITIYFICLFYFLDVLLNIFKACDNVGFGWYHVIQTSQIRNTTDALVHELRLHCWHRALLLQHKVIHV